jgi:hypothetical protein
MAARRLLRTLLAVVLVTAALWPGPARAWHESGHRIVARIAWDELTPAQRALVSDLLTRHPRFAEDFVARMPAAIKGLAETDTKRRQWVFMHAAIWPDLIKEEVKNLGKQLAAAAGPERAALERRFADARQYDNPGWHFDNRPIFVDPYAMPARPAADPRAVGVQQALPVVLREFVDPGLPAERRAVALAWLIHLLGDSHQPLHAATIFSAVHLPQGDLGGNRLGVTTPASRTTPTNLHVLWDGLFGGDEQAEPSQKRTIITTHPRRALQAELAVPAGATLEWRIDRWLDESYRAADAVVYAASIRAALLAPLPAGAAAPPPVALDSAYLQAARTTAMRRVALAGYRLADCIGLALPRR